MAEPKPPQLTARSATWVIMRREEKRDDADKALLDQLQEQHPEFAEAMELSESFAQLVGQRHPEGLDFWLEQAGKSCLRAFQRFAGGLRDDYEAVKAGLTLPWSTGPVEGQINRLHIPSDLVVGRGVSYVEGGSSLNFLGIHNPYSHELPKQKCSNINGLKFYH